MLAADVVCVLVFALAGRASHGESDDLPGVLRTAWPFLAGYAVGLLAARGWRDPLGRRTGLAVWVAAVAGGMVLRALTGAGVAVSFVVVASVVLGLFLLGWRTVVTLVRHRVRARATAP